MSIFEYLFLVACVASQMLASTVDLETVLYVCF